MISDYELLNIGWERVGSQIFSPKSIVISNITAKPFHVIYTPDDFEKAKDFAGNDAIKAIVTEDKK